MARTKSTKKNEVATKDQPTTTSPTSLPKAQESAPAAVPATVPTAIAAPAEPRRLEIVKPDARANIVPINLEDEIRKLAYEFSARRGFVPGYENEDWLAAEREIRQRYHQRSA